MTGLTTNAGAYEADATNKLKGIFDQATKFGLKRHETSRRRDAVIDAGEVELTTESPELEDFQTVYGSVYNETVLKGHYAATKSAMSEHINKIAESYPNDSDAYNKTINEIKGKYLNEVAPEIRGQAATTFNTLSTSKGLEIQTRVIKDNFAAAQLAQKESITNTRNSALEALTKGNEKGFGELTKSFEFDVMNSNMTKTEKVTQLIKYKRDANVSVSMGEIREFIRNGNYGAAIKHINSVRDGKIPMVFEGTGLSNEDAADYLQAQFNKFVGDYDAELKAETNRNKLEDVQQADAKEEANKTGYDLLAKGELTMEWVDKNRHLMDDGDYKYFKEEAVSGGTFSTVKANPAVYMDFMNRINAGEDVTKEMSSALRVGQLEKTWWDQLTKAKVDKRFEDADDYLTTAMKVENEFNPAAQKMAANARMQFEQWKENNPEATRKEAIIEAQAIVEDSSLVRGKLDKISTPKPRHIVYKGDEVDVNQTMALTNKEYRKLHNVPVDATPKEAIDILKLDPNYLEQVRIIKQWKEMQSR